MITNTGMSIYNKKTNETTKETIYYKHYIENVMWQNTDKVNQDKGFNKNDNVNVYIPYNKNDLTDYVNPKEYNNTNKWTIDNGDFIVRGNTTELQVNKIKELIDKYQEVYTITHISIKDYGTDNSKHIEIKGE